MVFARSFACFCVSVMNTTKFDLKQSKTGSMQWSTARWETCEYWLREVLFALCTEIFKVLFSAFNISTTSHREWVCVCVCETLHIYVNETFFAITFHCRFSWKILKAAQIYSLYRTDTNSHTHSLTFSHTHIQSFSTLK